jgi:hypothetical protein
METRPTGSDDADRSHAAGTGAETETDRGTVPDFVDHDVRLLLCGINPGLHSARYSAG